MAAPSGWLADFCFGIFEIMHTIELKLKYTLYLAECKCIEVWERWQSVYSIIMAIVCSVYICNYLLILIHVHALQTCSHPLYKCVCVSKMNVTT